MAVKSKKAKTQKVEPPKASAASSDSEEEEDHSSQGSSQSEDDDANDATVELPHKKSKADEGETTATTDNNAALYIAPSFVVDSKFGSGGSGAGRNRPVIVILDQASLETIKTKHGIYELLNCDDHRDMCRKKLHKDPNIFRPDILHQELLALLDSPLNKAGLLQIYIQTTKRVLIEVNPSIRLPRTYKRFSGLMVQLLHKLKIKASTKSEVLLRVIKNPVSQYLPAGTRSFGLSSQGTLYRPMALAKTFVPDTQTTTSSSQPPSTCFVIGAMSTGHVSMNDYPFIETMLSVSDYPLSGAAAISRLMGAIEEKWGVV